MIPGDAHTQAQAHDNLTDPAAVTDEPLTPVATRVRPVRNTCEAGSGAVPSL